MGNSQHATPAASSSENTEWAVLKRTPILPTNLFPKEVSANNCKRLYFHLPCSAKEFWDYAFTMACDSQASKISMGVPISPVTEQTVKAEMIELEVEGQLQIFTQRQFTIQPIPDAMQKQLVQYANDQVDSDAYGIPMTVYQAKGHGGYMEFCIGFPSPWSKYIKAAGDAIVSDTPEDETYLSIMYVTLSVQVDFHTDNQSGCLGSFWLTRREQEIQEYLYERLEARFDKTVTLFERMKTADAMFEV